jgi:hypothetical protein
MHHRLSALGMPSVVMASAAAAAGERLRDVLVHSP